MDTNESMVRPTSAQVVADVKDGDRQETMLVILFGYWRTKTTFRQVDLVTLTGVDRNRLNRLKGIDGIDGTWVAFCPILYLYVVQSGLKCAG